MHIIVNCAKKKKKKKKKKMQSKIKKFLHIFPFFGKFRLDFRINLLKRYLIYAKYNGTIKKIFLLKFFNDN